MKNPITWLIAACVVIGLLVACSVWMGYGRYTYKKSAEDYRKQYEACESAPFDTIIKHDSVIITDTLWRSPKNVVIIIHDTTVKWCEKYFADKYLVISGKDTGVINYAIAVKDCEAKVKFPSIRFPKQIVIITDRVDTCIAKPPAYIPKNHYGVGLAFIGNSVTKFPNLGADFFYSFKDVVSLRVGVEGNTYNGQIYAKIGFDLFLDQFKKNK